MPIKKKRSTSKTIKRTRRSPYERSLEHAAKRLDRALAEQLQSQSDLDALAVEIPRLQGIIRALEPDPTFTRKDLSSLRKNVPFENRVKAPASDQAEFLARFVKPVSNLRMGVPMVSDDADEPFLPPAGGEELLP